MKTVLKKVVAKVAVASAAFGMAVTSAMAQTATTPSTPVELIAQHSVGFTEDTKSVLFAGAGLIIGALLIKALVNLVINFFRRG